MTTLSFTDLMHLISALNKCEGAHELRESIARLGTLAAASDPHITLDAPICTIQLAHDADGASVTIQLDAIVAGRTPAPLTTSRTQAAQDEDSGEAQATHRKPLKVQHQPGGVVAIVHDSGADDEGYDLDYKYDCEDIRRRLVETGTVAPDFPLRFIYQFWRNYSEGYWAGWLTREGLDDTALASAFVWWVSAGCEGSV